MLRFFIVLLLLANAAYFAWTQGYLADLGLAPTSQSEPARMRAQIKPDAMRLLNNTEAGRIEVAATPPAAQPTECLESSLLDERTATAVRNASSALPDGSWTMIAANEPGRWIVYMGKYPGADVMAKKKAELRQLGVNFEALQNKNLEPGISLGGHPSQAEAAKVLDDLSKRGVRTAKVVQEKPPTKGQILRLAQTDDALRAQLAPIKTALGAGSLKTCKA